jgi:hypothetical protein
MSSRKQDSPAAYGDVKTILDIAVTKPGLQYVCETSGAATHFKQRCNRYRNLLRQMQTELMFGTPGVRAETAYDILVISQVNAELLPDRKGAILIFRHEQPRGKLIDPESGEEIHLPTSLVTGNLADDA